MESGATLDRSRSRRCWTSGSGKYKGQSTPNFPCLRNRAARAVTCTGCTRPPTPRERWAGGRSGMLIPIVWALPTINYCGREEKRRATSTMIISTKETRNRSGAIIIHQNSKRRRQQCEQGRELLLCFPSRPVCGRPGDKRRPPAI